MRQQYGTGRHGTTIFPSVTANTTAATPRHTRPIVSAHSTTQLRLAPYNLARPLLAPCVPPLRDTRTLHRHCSNLQPLRPALPQPHTGPTPSRYLGPPRRHRAPPSAGHCPAYPPGSNAPTPAATHPPHSRHTPAAEHRPHTIPTPRTTQPTPGPASRRALPRLSAVLQRTNARRNALAPFKTLPCRRTPTPHRPDASDHPADTGPRLAARHRPASPPCSNAPTPRRNAPAPFKAHPCHRTTAPTPSRHLEPPRRHRDPPRAGHKKIRLCEPDLFICQ